ncbi:MAG: transglycosylase SLT domain-containing protein [Flavobacteriales bacterium]|nr:transglycosylase SLT domain-containing protein [Flavobacteriales bacterium]
MNATPPSSPDPRAGHEAERFPLLEYSEAIGPSQELRFVTRASSPELLKTLDRWLLEPKEVEARKHLLRSYAEEIPRPGPLRSLRAKGMRGDSISPYDVHFREHAAVAGWDWQLLAAMAWKETRFDSTVTSSKGAMGIMQFMPQTAARMGLDTTSNMEDHIQAAALPEPPRHHVAARGSREGTTLAFRAGFPNAGPGHIIDAQRLAEQLGLDPKRWDGNVERAVLLLAKPRYFLRPEMKNGYCKGSQVFHYVRGVLTVYQQLKAPEVMAP